MKLRIVINAWEVDRIKFDKVRSYLRGLGIKFRVEQVNEETSA